MKVVVRSYCGLLYIMAITGVAAQQADAQPTSPTRAPIFGEAPVGDILKRMGAKVELGIRAKELDNFSIHFDRMDVNRDGRHSREEYVEKGRYMTPQARAGIFQAADGNSDGVVTKAEYVLNRIITDEGKAIVQRMDDDEDGLVERVEFVNNATKLLSDRELAEQVFAALDTNGDGALPIPEYLRVWGRWARVGRNSAEERIAVRRAELANVNESGRTPPESGERTSGGRPPFARPRAAAGPPDIDEIFDRFDRNNDGKVSKAELPRLLAERLLGHADKNKDGVIDKQEADELRQHRRGPDGTPRE